MMQQLTLPAGWETRNPLRTLSVVEGPGALMVEAYLEGVPGWDGPRVQRLLARWLDTGPGREEELGPWLAQQVRGNAAEPGRPGSIAAGQRFERARRRAERWYQAGIRALIWRLDALPPARSAAEPCPRVLFAAGSLDWHRPGVALFNSRKPRPVQPQEPWLAALRLLLPQVKELATGLLSSC